MNLCFRRLCIALALAGTGWVAQAHSYTVGSITIGHPHARATAPSQQTGAGYLKLVNQGASGDRLVGASSPAAKGVEMHSMSMDGDVMRMRRVDAVDLPAGGTVELKPGGFHLMFMGLKAPLKEGQRFPMKLRFEKAGEVDVEVTVDPVKAAGTADGASKPAAHRH